MRRDRDGGAQPRRLRFGAPSRRTPARADGVTVRQFVRRGRTARARFAAPGAGALPKATALSREESTATSRLRKAVTSHRTPKFCFGVDAADRPGILRLRRH
ncbi:MAG: hypothetical protein ACK55I_10470, partial [bacterium]